MYRSEKGSDLRQPRSPRGLHVTRRETESYGENVGAQDDTPYKCLFKEVDESQGRLCALPRALQFLSRPFIAESDTRDGVWYNRSRLEFG